MPIRPPFGVREQYGHKRLQLRSGTRKSPGPDLSIAVAEARHRKHYVTFGAGIRVAADLVQGLRCGRSCIQSHAAPIGGRIGIRPSLVQSPNMRFWAEQLVERMFAQ